ncbi:MAG: hypothetical protein R2770_16075 [Acidimicrobiales bacterium]|nr:hypothetical protein [Acidimicrobiales bacterium]
MRKNREALRRSGVAALAVAACLALGSAPAGAADAYSDGGSGSTGQTTDTGGGSTGDTGGTGTGADGTTGGGDTTTGTDTSAGGTTGSGTVGQVDDGQLAFTGGDALSLTLIGGAALGAGALMVAVSRRRDDD